MILGVLINLSGRTVEKLQAMRITYDGTNTYQSVLIGLSNTGTQILRPSGNLQIMNMAGQRLQNIPVKLDAFLPQNAINYPVFIHSHTLAPGVYQATLFLQYGHNNMVSYKTSFVIPLPQLAKNTTITTAVSDLVMPGKLTPWYYVVGIVVAFLLLSALFFWGRSVYRSTMKLKKKFKDKRAGSGS
jgi:hypothetical protein